MRLRTLHSARLWRVAYLVGFVLGSTWTGTTTVIPQPGSHSGAARYFHIDDVGTDCYSSAIMIGVGTAMTVDDYEILAQAIVTTVNDTSALLVIVDPNPHNPIKLDPKAFATTINRLVAQLHEASTASFHFCSRENATVVVGGHSASGAAAFYGSKLFDFPVAGFIGLDPFPIQRREPLLIPALFWGFSVTTCGVSVQRAALAAYNQSMSGQRVMYQLQNSHRKKLPSNESCFRYSPD